MMTELSSISIRKHTAALLLFETLNKAIARVMC